MGINAGDKIAVIGPWLVPSQEASYVARLARVRIVAETRPEEYFESTSSGELDAAFAGVGAKGVITFDQPRLVTGWQRLADTNYFVHQIGSDQTSP
jgi:hypothetical protein